MCALLNGLLAHDFELEPARALTSMMPIASGASGATTASMSPWLGRAAAMFALALTLVTFDGPTDLDDLLARLTAWLSTLAELWEGHLATAPRRDSRRCSSRSRSGRLWDCVGPP